MRPRSACPGSVAPAAPCAQAGPCRAVPGRCCPPGTVRGILPLPSRCRSIRRGPVPGNKRPAAGSGAFRAPPAPFAPARHRKPQRDRTVPGSPRVAPRSASAPPCPEPAVLSGIPAFPRGPRRRSRVSPPGAPRRTTGLGGGWAARSPPAAAARRCPVGSLPVQPAVPPRLCPKFTRSRLSSAPFLPALVPSSPAALQLHERFSPFVALNSHKETW